MRANGVVLAVEPTGNLDEETGGEIMQLFGELNRQEGITFVIVTRSGEIAAPCSRRMTMKNGRLSQ